MTQLTRMAVSCCLTPSWLPSPAERDPGLLSLSHTHIYLNFLKSVYFLLHWVFVESHGPSLAVASGLLTVAVSPAVAHVSGLQQFRRGGSLAAACRL